MPASPFGMTGVADLGGLGEGLQSQVKQETDEQRKKRLAQMLRPVSNLFGANSGIGPVSGTMAGMARGGMLAG